MLGFGASYIRDLTVDTIRHKLKSRDISFVHESFRNGRIGLEFYTEHDSHTAVLCAEIPTDS